MKKILPSIVIIVMILVAIDLGLTYYSGVKVEQWYRDINLEFNRASPIKVEIVSYTRGFFRSEAVYRINVGGLNITPEFRDTIKHGPIVFEKNWKAPILFKMGVIESDTPVAHIRTEIGYSGSGTNVFEAKPYEFQQLDAVFNTSGISGENEFSKDLDHFKTNVKVQDLKYKDNVSSLEVDQFKVVSDVKKISGLLWKGDTDITANQVQSANPVMSVLLKQLDVKWNITPNQDMLNLLFNLNLNKMVFNQSDLGSQQFMVQMQNVDQNVVEKMYQKQTLSKDEVSGFFIKRPSLTVKGNLNLMEGPINVDLNLAIGGQSINVDNPKTVLETLDGHIYAELPKDLLRTLIADQIVNTMSSNPVFAKKTTVEKKAIADTEVDSKITEYQQMGLLTEKEGRYAVEFNIQNGKVMTPKGVQIIDLAGAASPSSPSQPPSNTTDVPSQTTPSPTAMPVTP